MTEIIEIKGIIYGVLIESDELPQNTTFYTEKDMPFQFGVVAHRAGYVEPAHYHKIWPRMVKETTETLVVTKGRCRINFFDDSGNKVGERELCIGDAIMLIGDTGHNFVALEDFKGIKTKQGPYLSMEHDKVIL